MAVTSLELNNLALTGTYPSTLGNLGDLSNLQSIGNDLTGLISVNNICASTFIVGDETNCPNKVDESGCCDAVRMTSPSSPYLNDIIAGEMNSSDCDTFAGTSNYNVCGFMGNKENHYIFDTNQYPDPDTFPYKDWLKVRKENVESHCVLYSELKHSPFTTGAPRACASFLWYILERIEPRMARQRRPL